MIKENSHVQGNDVGAWTCRKTHSLKKSKLPYVSALEMKAIYFTTNITFQNLLLICNKTKLTEKRVLNSMKQQ